MAAVVATVGVAVGLLGFAAGVAWWLTDQWREAAIAGIAGGIAVTAVGGSLSVTEFTCTHDARTVSFAGLEGGTIEGRPSLRFDRDKWRNDFDCADSCL